MKKVIIDHDLYDLLLSREYFCDAEFSSIFPDEKYDRSIFIGLSKAIVFDPAVVDWKDLKTLIDEDEARFEE